MGRGMTPCDTGWVGGRHPTIVNRGGMGGVQRPRGLL